MNVSRRIPGWKERLKNGDWEDVCSPEALEGMRLVSFGDFALLRVSRDGKVYQVERNGVKEIDSDGKGGEIVGIESGCSHFIIQTGFSFLNSSLSFLFSISIEIQSQVESMDGEIILRGKYFLIKRKERSIDLRRY